MARQVVERIVCYEVWTGTGDGSYDAHAIYDDWAELVTDLKAALDAVEEMQHRPLMSVALPADKSLPPTTTTDDLREEERRSAAYDDACDDDNDPDYEDDDDGDGAEFDAP